MDIALAPLTVGRPAPLEHAAAAAAAGFRRIGLTLWVPDARLSPLCDDQQLLQHTRLRLDDLGVSVLDVGVVVLSPSLVLPDVRLLVGAGRALGGDRVLVVNQDDVTDRAAAQFAQVAAVARDAGMLASLEFMPYTATRTIHSAIDLVRRAGSSDTGLVLDLLHLCRSGGTEEDVRALAPGLLHLVQVCDGRRSSPPAHELRAEALRDRLYPGQGELPLMQLLPALPAAPWTVEAPVATDLHRPPPERAQAAATATAELLRALAEASGRSRRGRGTAG